MNRFGVGLGAVLLAAGLVLPSLHLVLRPAEAAYLREGRGPAPMAHALLDAQLADWDQGRRDVERTVNPEWDLGHHTFFALALVNAALDDIGDLEREAYRDRVDAVARELWTQPADHFHLPYFKRGRFQDPASRSLFLEGEKLLVLGARLVAWPDAAQHGALAQLGRDVVTQMTRGRTAGSLPMGESYPDECWMFDNTLALAALVVAHHVLGRAVEGADALLEQWRTELPRHVDPTTGLLPASTTWAGDVLDGPEGSSAFGVAHFLQLVDPRFAREQYERARNAFVRRPLGFAYAEEWPARGAAKPAPRAGHPDVDSGPIVPFVHASPGASGMAFLGAMAFRDTSLLGELTASMELAAFPERREGQLRFLASNGLGDALMVYATTGAPLKTGEMGPLFERVRPGRGGA